ncbi:MAG: isochorismate synthase MenF [Candidatus Zixiibacteriota bacterium]
MTERAKPMPILCKPSERPKPDALEKLAERIRKMLDLQRHKTYLVRLTCALDMKASPLEWLACQSTQERLAWRSRCDDKTVAGIGSADSISLTSTDELPALFSKIRGRLSDCDNTVRYYGGIRFDPKSGRSGSTDRSWRRFGVGRFVLPRFEMRQEGDRTELICNLLPQQDRNREEDIVSELRQLTFLPQRNRATFPTVNSRDDSPGRTGWEQMISQALSSLDQSPLEKVVLARRTTLVLSAPINPAALLLALSESTASCYQYLLSSGCGDTMVGASPELLFSSMDGKIYSEAIAGTRARGINSLADRELGRKLMLSDKERREHAYVGKQIQTQLENLGVRLSPSSDVAVLKLARVQHLVTRYKGSLNGKNCDADILAALHPTPAVGGEPTETALDLIARLEPFDRGWYAGPVGWIGPECAEFAVALRCGLVSNSHLNLYSGAGIVTGSTAAGEWREIEDKLSNFIGVITNA